MTGDETQPDDEIPETLALYHRLRGIAAPVRRGRRRRADPDDENAPFTPGRDPRGIADVLAVLTQQAGWEPELAREDVIARWNEVVGEDTARHTRPVDLQDGVLTVRCDSTAWAKQLQLLRTQIVTELVRRFPTAGVQSLRFLGPDVPSWKRGPRTVPGRGPRDTYG